MKSIIEWFRKRREQSRRRRILKQSNRAYAHMKKYEPELWKEFQDEVKLWDQTLMDGLDDE